MAISLQVMSAPYPLHTRRYGKLPTVVSGARYSLPRLVSDNLGHISGKSRTIQHAAISKPLWALIC